MHEQGQDEIWFIPDASEERRSVMIDLDELLNGTPSWEEVVEFWKDNGEFSEECYLVSAIEKWLLTEDQRKTLFEANISIEKMLNGRYQMQQEGLVRRLYETWNAKLGFQAFGN